MYADSSLTVASNNTAIIEEQINKELLAVELLAVGQH